MKKIMAILAAFVLPAITFAQFGEIDTFFEKILLFINGTLIPLVFGVSLLVFIYGMFQFLIRGGEDSKGQEAGKQLMIWAVVGFVAMVSIWGVVNLVAGGLQEGLGTNNTGPTSIPKGPRIGI